MTLVERGNRRVVGLGLYDSSENLRAHEIMNGPPPASMPEVMKQSRSRQSFVGLFEVVERDGI